MDRETVVKVQNLKKSYKLYNSNIDRLKEALNPFKKSYHKDHFALNGINFDIKKGETLGIIGTNGSGKSTLLKILTNVTTPTEGEVMIHGKVSALLELGAGFNPDYTGIQNIYLNGTMMGYSESEMKAKIPEIIKFADIGEFIDQPVKNYSSGMFARLAFAVAINVEPDILIIDEALSVGDVFFQNKCFRKFDELKRKNTTILFVSHDMESIKEMCTQVLWIERGEQKMFGDKVEVCNAYARQFLLNNNEEVNKEDSFKKASYAVQSLELEKYPPISYSKESLLHPQVRIQACFISNLSDDICYDLVGNESYKISVVFQTDIEIEECIVGFVLQNKKGVSIINSNTLITGEEKVFFAKAKHAYKVDFKIKLPKLASDEYILDCAVASGTSVMNSAMYTWLYGALRIMIHNPDKCLGIFSVDAEVSVFEKNNSDKCI